MLGFYPVLDQKSNEVMKLEPIAAKLAVRYATCRLFQERRGELELISSSVCNSENTPSILPTAIIAVVARRYRHRYASLPTSVE
jgi:hypothetical protein